VAPQASSVATDGPSSWWLTPCRQRSICIQISLIVPTMVNGQLDDGSPHQNVTLPRRRVRLHQLLESEEHPQICCGIRDNPAQRGPHSLVQAPYALDPCDPEQAVGDTLVPMRARAPENKWPPGLSSCAPITSHCKSTAVDDRAAARMCAAAMPMRCGQIDTSHGARQPGAFSRSLAGRSLLARSCLPAHRRGTVLAPANTRQAG
jgi:hypothetical protein